MTDRCDLCDGTQGVNWTWVTPSTATQEEAEAGLGFWAEDPEWAVCDVCHSLILSDKRQVLEERAFMHMKSQIMLGYQPDVEAWGLMNVRAHVQDVHRMFFEHKDTYKPA